MTRIVASLLVMAIVLAAFPSRAAEIAGTIVRLEGTALITTATTVRAVKASVGDQLRVGDVIKTKAGSLAMLGLVDGSKAVLKEESTLEIQDLKHDKVAQGKVVFEIRKQGEGKGLVVTAKAVTMGIRGTRFGVVCDEADLAIYLKEGSLEIGAMEGEFKRHRRTMEEEFRQQEQEMRREFEKTTKAMEEEFARATREMERGNIELVKQFIMEGGQAVRITGNEVRDAPIPPELEDDFKLLDTF